MHVLLRKALRSPHLIEVIASYGTVCLLLTYFCVMSFGMKISEWFFWTCCGTVLYTFLEYIFHRWILHEFLSGAHTNHHRKPRNLRIIATPIFPVQLYDFIVVIILMYFIGREKAYAINCGISFGQCVMDTVHIIFHATNRPWFLESARSYHTHHHFVEQENSHGLTTGFWDLIFGTYPDTWCYQRKYPFMKYLQLPFPLVTFIVISFLSGDTSKSVVTTTRETPKGEHPSKAAHGSPRNGFVVATFCTAMLVVLGWEGIPL